MTKVNAKQIDWGGTGITLTTGTGPSDGVHGIGGAAGAHSPAGVGGVFTHGRGGTVALRAEGDVEVHGNLRVDGRTLFCEEMPDREEMFHREVAVPAWKYDVASAHIGAGFLAVLLVCVALIPKLVGWVTR